MLWYRFLFYLFSPLLTRNSGSINCQWVLQYGGYAVLVKCLYVQQVAVSNCICHYHAKQHDNNNIKMGPSPHAPIYMYMSDVTHKTLCWIKHFLLAGLLFFDFSLYNSIKLGFTLLCLILTYFRMTFKSFFNYTRHYRFQSTKRYSKSNKKATNINRNEN